MKSERVAVVTGAAGGIGLACALRFLKDDARVVLIDADRDELKRAMAGLSGTPDAWAIVADVSSRVAVARALDETLERFGHIDAMINIAGIASTQSSLEITDEEFDRVLNVNLKGTLYGMQEAARRMLQSGGGAIVNMSSLQGAFVLPKRVAYGVSKAAIDQLTASFAIDLAPLNIRVNAVAPGTIATERVQKGLLQNPESYKAVLERTPIGRVGDVEEVADVVAFLASEQASYIVGQTIYLDGGRSKLNLHVPKT